MRSRSLASPIVDATRLERGARRDASSSQRVPDDGSSPQQPCKRQRQLEPEWPAFFTGCRYKDGGQRADPEQVRSFYAQASRVFAGDACENHEAHLNMNAAASGAFLKLLQLPGMRFQPGPG